ncbi:hypothetical protein EZS27_006586 [termite gut metagenome]|uniref:HicB-like antitoxin of toxin-antitoxin system domain-containing protein n=1 Tax=termite gut metagenome TaxID=433724 RepID=A0A5J4SI56_9ZZZZ
MKIIVVIEKAKEEGYGIYAPSVAGLFGFGLTEQEAKESLNDALESIVEEYKEREEPVPEALNNPEFEYRYDLSAFFKLFPFLSVSGFANAVGVNPSLMRRYKAKNAFAGEKQKAIIQQRFNEIINKMSTVQF